MSPDSLSATLSALADPTRRAILRRLAHGEMSVNEIAKPYPMSVAAVSKHIKVLESAGLVSRGREAQFRPCRLEGAPLEDVSIWLDDFRRFWDASLGALEGVLAEMKRDAARKTKNTKRRKVRTK